MSSQEKEIRLYLPSRLKKIGPGQFEIEYTAADMEDNPEPLVLSRDRGPGMRNGTLW